MKPFAAWPVLCLIVGCLGDVCAQELEEALRGSDLIVEGHLTEVVVNETSWASAEGGRESGRQGTARLVVDRLLWGDLALDTALELSWTYIEGTDGTEQKPRQDGHRGVFFLVCGGSGDDRCTATGPSLAVDEQQRLPVERRDEVVELLVRHPVRLRGAARVASGEKPSVTFELTNAGDAPLALPGIVSSAGTVSLGPGMRLRVRSGSATGPEVSRSLMKLRQVSSLEPLTLAPGERREIALDLSGLFKIERAGFYVVEVELDGFPPQFPHIFQLER